MTTLDTSEYWAEGLGYHRTAVGARRRPKVFTPEIVYNLLAMAIEKYFMAFFEARGTLPDNHTFTDLMRAAHRLHPLPPDLAEALTDLELLQDVCPIFEDYQRRAPSPAQLTRLYWATDRVKAYCNAPKTISTRNPGRVLSFSV